MDAVDFSRATRRVDRARVVEGVKGGDVAFPLTPDSQGGFWTVYDEAVPVVYGFLIRRTDRESAEDLTQEVFVAAARAFVAGSSRRSRCRGC